METFIYLFISLVVIAILWRMAKFVAKIVIVCLVAWVFYMSVFVWTQPDYAEMLSYEEYLPTEVAEKVTNSLLSWDQLREDKDILVKPDDVLVPIN